MLSFILLGYQRRDIRLKEANTNAEEYKTNAEDADGGVRVLNDTRYRGDDNDDVSERGNNDGDIDGPVQSVSNF
jgi:hypothetical protein